MSVDNTNVWQSPDPSPLLWIATGGMALVAHLTLLQVGITTYQAQLSQSKDPIVETKIFATALQIAGVEAAPPPKLKATEPASPIAEPQVMNILKPRDLDLKALPSTVTADPIAQTLEPLSPVSQPFLKKPMPEVTAPVVQPVQPRASVAPAPKTVPLNQPGVAPVSAAATPIAPPSSIETETPEERLDAIAMASPVIEAIEVLEPPEAPPEPEPEPRPEPKPLPDLASSLPAQPSDITQDQPGIASANASVQTTQQAQKTYNTVLDFLRGYDGGSCFAALPVLAEDGAFRFETFANSRTDLNRFRNTLEEETGTLPGTVMKPVSDAQCQALPFVTAAARYPEFQLYFDLSARDITSGDILTGKLGNTSGGFVSLLLIDDEGIVQDLGSFLKFRPGFAGFKIPMTLKGSPVETHQLLMALSTRARLKTLQSLSGQQAKDFFQHLAVEILMQGGGEDVALVAFSVR